ncbi:hypothetical protein PVAND_017044 [Polypedilum vanderplanki]|uniref:Uncharacterized protein n=1 Tax=Polypedilum vanderplanki TaxID=319348 RepID=A0A9J6BH55_POLVA|nr:hypothetical protein PVAND_017044 [Polypedilum vanderplanki]
MFFIKCFLFIIACLVICFAFERGELKCQFANVNCVEKSIRERRNEGETKLQEPQSLSYKPLSRNSKTTAVCLEQEETGPCDEYVVNYAFDQETQQCKAFYYGGCEGNNNRFETKEECESICHQHEQSSFTQPTRPLLPTKSLHPAEIINVEGMQIPSNCTDNKEFANCTLIVKGNYCNHKYYRKFCCRSCVLARQISLHNNEI